MSLVYNHKALLLWMLFSIALVSGCDSELDIPPLAPPDMSSKDLPDSMFSNMDMSDIMDLDLVDQGMPDQMVDQATEPSCIGGSRFGLKTDLVSFTSSIDNTQSAPRFASLDQNQWGVIWLTQNEEGSNVLYFQRVNREETEWNAVGEPLFLGRSQGAQHQVHATNTGFTVLWINQTNSSLSQEGIFIASIDQEGQLTQPPSPVPQSFGTQYLDSQWKNGLGGMLIYSKMGQGLVSSLFDHTGVIGETHVISGPDNIRSPQLVFGGGGWATSWISVSETQTLIYLALLSEGGSLIGDPKVIDTQSTPIPPLRIGYGNGSYILGYSINDPRVIGNEPNRLILDVRLLDENGSNLGQFVITDGEGNLRLSSIAWLNPSIFALVWQDYKAPYAALGISRINELGQPLSPVYYQTESPSLLAEAYISGNPSEGFGILTQDPNPSPTGLYSEESRLAFMHFGVCEED